MYRERGAVQPDRRTPRLRPEAGLEVSHCIPGAGGLVHVHHRQGPARAQETWISASKFQSRMQHGRARGLPGARGRGAGRRGPPRPPGCVCPMRAPFLGKWGGRRVADCSGTTMGPSLVGWAAGPQTMGLGQPLSCCPRPEADAREPPASAPAVTSGAALSLRGRAPERDGGEQWGPHARRPARASARGSPG